MDLVEPIVAVNGSTDHTAEIAELYGVKVFDLPEQGKLPAIQHILRSLGQRALAPLLIIDGDTIPRHPRKWHDRMLSSLDPKAKHPVVVAGPAWYTPNSERLNGSPSRVARSLFRLAVAALTSKTSSSTGSGGGQYGPNQGLHIQNQAALDRVISLDHFWPEDLALTKSIVNNGEGVFKQILNLDAMVNSPESDAYQPISSWFKYGLSRDNIERAVNESNQVVQSKYMQRGAPGPKPYDEN